MVHELGVATAGGACVLTPDLEAPVVADTPVQPHLLHPLDVITQLGGEVVGEDLERGAVHKVSLPVQEPLGDLVLVGL